MARCVFRVGLGKLHSCAVSWKTRLLNNIKAWNLKPESPSGRKSRMPSAEMVESAVIFVYGCSNVFLEHLASWGKAWSHGDLQHVSIAVLFFGGGLVRTQFLLLQDIFG